jgi:hypothetical protein
MHKLCLHRIKAPSPEFACEKANELLNPKPPTPNFTGKTIENIKKTNLFKDEYDSNLDECLEGICNTESGMCEWFIDELIEMDCENSAKELENLYGELMDNTSPYFYSIIGCLSKNNKRYINGDPIYHRWDVSDYSIEGLNKSYQKEFANFNVLKDLNEIGPDDSDDSFSLCELNYEEEKGETFIVFSDVKLY